MAAKAEKEAENGKTPEMGHGAIKQKGCLSG